MQPLRIWHFGDIDTHRKCMTFGPTATHHFGFNSQNFEDSILSQFLTLKVEYNSFQFTNSKCYLIFSSVFFSD